MIYGPKSTTKKGGSGQFGKGWVKVLIIFDDKFTFNDEVGNYWERGEI